MSTTNNVNNDLNWKVLGFMNTEMTADVATDTIADMDADTTCDRVSLYIVYLQM